MNQKTKSLSCRLQTVVRQYCEDIKYTEQFKKSLEKISKIRLLYI